MSLARIIGAAWCVAMFAAAAAWGETRFVNPNSPSPGFPFTSWDTGAHTIQEAATASVDGDVIVVTNGVYDTGGIPAPGESLTNRVYLNKNVLIQSVNGPAVTIIKGKPDPLTTNGPNAVRGVYLGSSGRLDGFTVTNGHTQVGSFGNDFWGGGVFSGSLSNCVISGNSAYQFGGGLCFASASRCIIAGNSTDSAGFPSGGSGAFKGNMDNCLFQDNRGAFSSAAVLADDSFGAGFGPEIKNCTITRNGNVAFFNIVSGPLPNVRNSIVFSNKLGSGSALYSYSCVEGGSGVGTINQWPQFVDPDNNDFRLLPTSPCIDSGLNLGTELRDLDDNDRIVDCIVDMGAYESQTHRNVAPLVLGTNGADILSGDLAPAPEDGTQFEATPFPSVVDHVFRLTNAGPDVLRVSGVATSGAHASNFKIMDWPRTVPAGQASNLVVRFNPVTFGSLTAEVQVAGNNYLECTYTFRVEGLGIASEIVVMGNEVSITDGDTSPSLADHTDFGSIDIDLGAITRTFTVSNSGNGSLTLGTVTTNGAAAAFFKVISQPASPLAPGATATFDVAFQLRQQRPGRKPVQLLHQGRRHDSGDQRLRQRHLHRGWRYFAEPGRSHRLWQHRHRPGRHHAHLHGFQQRHGLPDLGYGHHQRAACRSFRGDLATGRPAGPRCRYHVQCGLRSGGGRGIYRRGQLRQQRLERKPVQLRRQGCRCGPGGTGDRRFW